MAMHNNYRYRLHLQVHLHPRFLPLSYTQNDAPNMVADGKMDNIKTDNYEQ